VVRFFVGRIKALMYVIIILLCYIVIIILYIICYYCSESVLPVFTFDDNIKVLLRTNSLVGGIKGVAKVIFFLWEFLECRHVQNYLTLSLFFISNSELNSLIVCSIHFIQ